MKSINKLSIVFLGLLLMFFTQCQDSGSADITLIPYPSEIEMGNGSFKLNNGTTIVVKDKDVFGEEAAYLKSFLEEYSLNIPEIKEESQSGGFIEFVLDESLDNTEAYELVVNKKGIQIKAAHGHGAFNAIQTLRQLLPIQKTATGLSIPYMSVKDAPAFTWRGMHLDVSRHFFTVDYVKRHIDRLSFYKFNKLHLHLTDDQGWRIEIKKYPKLTEVGAWRHFNSQDRYCMKMAKENPNFIIDERFIHVNEGDTIYGGFYTQDDIKELVEYARIRHIDIIPEIDMPGHMMAAIEAYPWLVEGTSGWGEIFSTPLSVYKEEVYTFSKDVLEEVMDLFPAKYIHIGADEVDKTFWKKSALAQKFMKEKGIESVEKLQSYFVHEMQEFVESKGKNIIAWDEILQGGTNPSVTVMYWRGWEKDAPLNAVSGGSEVIMTPTNPLYFDYENNSTSISSVYHMEVIPANVPADKAHLIQGAQANTWTESIPSEMQADYQMYPRMIALAERVWTNNTERFDNFSNRLLAHYPILDAMGVNYRLPDIEGVAQENVFIDKVDFMAESPISSMKIHYTLDGSIPTTESNVLSSPVTINKPTLVKMALFSPAGVRGEIYSMNFKPTEWKKAVEAEGTEAGLACDYYPNKSYPNTLALPEEAPEQSVVSNLKSPRDTNAFGMKLKGFIDVPETGIYSFFFTCDDGGVIYIGDEVIVDNDGNHSPVLKSGQAALEKGLHPFRLDFVEAGGGYTLKVQYSINNGPLNDIPDSWFVH